MGEQADYLIERATGEDIIFSSRSNRFGHVGKRNRIEAQRLSEYKKTEVVKPVNVCCDYCGKPAEYVDSAVIYHGKSYGMIYRCEPCGAYVGVHRGTNTPLGRLANAELRTYKKAAHNEFDKLWKTGKMTRRAAYIRLQKIMGMSADKAHIGKFGVPECKTLIDRLKKLTQGT